ncbi:B-cell receptor CD22-like isoform X2 [Mixophyes fleayi]|uniref:B-cell receptor CD22-like isoform X2 n=1 Tax=Mixophyes fleayi TaxID=3061075 RepID=UPI003F4DB662
MVPVWRFPAHIHQPRSLKHPVLYDTPGKPSIIGVGTVIEGNATIIQCHTEHTCATSPPSLEWNKPGQTKKQSLPLVGGYWREVSKLTYIPSYVDHGTPLRCRATYHNGLRSQLGATLNIIFPPRNVTVTLKRNRLREGSDVTLSCSSISNPAVQTYEWYQGNNKIKLRNRGPEITLRNLTRDIEPYSCTAVNEVGRGESALTEIPVLYAATEVRIIESQSEDGDIELTCYYLSSRPNVTHYSWMKDKSLLLSETGQTLLVNSSEQNYGSFSCIAHNSAGSSSSEELYIAAVYQPVQTNYGTYIAIAGIICLLLISFIVFFSWRRKVLQTSPSPTGGEPQEPTYTDLVKRDVSEDYDTLKPVIPAEVTDRGGNVASIAIYENISIGTKQ